MREGATVSHVVPMSEADLQQCVIETAHLLGWSVAHFRPAMTKHGWRTPVSADGKGFPDLVLVRGDRLVFVELKTDKGHLSVEQWDWLGRLELTPAEVLVWRPRDWWDGTVEQVLR